MQSLHRGGWPGGGPLECEFKGEARWTWWTAAASPSVEERLAEAGEREQSNCLNPLQLCRCRVWRLAAGRKAMRQTGISLKRAAFSWKRGAYSNADRFRRSRSIRKTQSGKQEPSRRREDGVHRSSSCWTTPSSTEESSLERGPNIFKPCCSEAAWRCQVAIERGGGRPEAAKQRIISESCCSLCIFAENTRRDKDTCPRC